MPNITQHLTFRTESRGGYKDQSYMTLVAELAGEPVGHIDYSTYENDLIIEFIKTKEGYTRRGIGSQMLTYLSNEYPDHDIDTGMVTDEGSKFFEKHPVRQIDREMGFSNKDFVLSHLEDNENGDKVSWHTLDMAFSRVGIHLSNYDLSWPENKEKFDADIAVVTNWEDAAKYLRDYRGLKINASNNISKFMSEFKAGTTPSHESVGRVYADTIDIDLIPIQNSILISSLVALDGPGTGYGTEAMKWLMSLANTHNVTLELYPSRIGKRGLKDKDLRAWYGRLGFVPDIGNKMVYKPNRGIPDHLLQSGNDRYENGKIIRDVLSKVVVSDMKIPEEVAKKFEELADEQRGDPEHAMLNAQKAIGGGLLSSIIEHAGDLIHRMSEMAGYGYTGRGYVSEKLEKLKRWLGNPYGVKKEIDENAEANARYDKIPLEDYWKNVNAALRVYVQEHRKLTPYNKAQKLANDIAIKCGNQMYAGALVSVMELEKMVNSPDWDKYARDYTLDESNQLKRFGRLNQESEYYELIYNNFLKRLDHPYTSQEDFDAVVVKTPLETISNFSDIMNATTQPKGDFKYLVNTVWEYNRDRWSNQQELVNHIKKIITEAKKGRTDPSILGELEDGRLYLIGGNTRAMVHQYLGIPTPVKIVPLYPDKKTNRAGKISKTAKRDLYYHGTSSNILRKILKEGLNPSPKDRQFDRETYDDRGGTRSLSPYGGVYMTTNFFSAYSFSNTAKKNYGGNNLLLALTYESETPTTLLDEDPVGFWMLDAVGTRFFDTLRHIEGSDTEKYHLSTWSLEYAFKDIEKGDITDKSHELVDKIISMISNSDTKLTNVAEKVLSREYSKRFVDDETLKHIKPKIVTLMIAVYKAYIKHLLDEELKHKMPQLNGSLQELKDTTNTLSKYINTQAHDKIDHRIRSTEPIGFSGKNRIITIVEFMEYKVGIKDAFLVKDVFIRYGTDWTMFEELFEERLGYPFRVFDKSGKEIHRYYGRAEHGALDKIWSQSLDAFKVSRIVSKYINFL